MTTQSETHSRVANDHALGLIFRDGRTFSHWTDRKVTDDTLKAVYDLMRLCPTSANGCPARLIFVRTPQAKERLRPALIEANVEKTMTAPVTVIVAYDVAFYEKIPQLFPQAPHYREMFKGAPAVADITAFRNGSLQGAYLILAARSLGLDCGPMSGFDNAKVDAAFFNAADPLPGIPSDFYEPGRLKSNFLCNLGYGDPSNLHPRNPRLAFEEACALL